MYEIPDYIKLNKAMALLTRFCFSRLISPHLQFSASLLSFKALPLRMSSSQSNGNRSYFGNITPQNVGEVDVLVDLRSDTVTRPSPKMREVMCNAAVGDDVMGEDPTVNELESRFAEFLGKEAALFVSSGTQGNLISILVHCSARGSEAIVGDSAHMFRYEQGAMAQFAGVQANKLPNNPDGTFSIEQLKRNIRDGSDVHDAKTSLICIEQTHNMCGGRVVPLEWIDQVTKVAAQNGIPVHMDGARLMNACVATGTPAKRYLRDVSSVSICLSKSLGAPIGSVLAGDAKFITAARRARKALGGGMRQAGILAAAGLYCLDNMISRLADDHEHAKLIAKSLHSINNLYLSVDPYQVETNMILLNIKNYHVDRICERLAQVKPKEKEELGCSISVLASPKNDTQIRLVLHCDVSKEMAIKAAEKICYVAKELFH